MLFIFTLGRMMFKFLVCLTLPLAPLLVSGETQENPPPPTSTQGYIQLLFKHPEILGPFGTSSAGEIEIIREQALIEQIEAQTGCKTGIIHQDKTWILLNDPVRLPDGKTTISSRLLLANALEGKQQVAIIVVLPDSRIVLNHTYHHATRSWEIEIPRVTVNQGESIKEACGREVKGETGTTINHLEYLGDMAANPEMTGHIIPIYLAEVISEEPPEQKLPPHPIFAFTVQEIKEGYIKGHLQVTQGETLIKIPLRDPLLAYALFQAELRNVLKATK